MRNGTLQDLAGEIERRLPGVVVRTSQPGAVGIVVEPLRWPAWLFNSLALALAVGGLALCAWAHIDNHSARWTHLLIALFDIGLIGMFGGVSVSLVQSMRKRAFVVDHKTGIGQMTHVPGIKAVFKIQDVRCVFAGRWRCRGRWEGDICVEVRGRKRYLGILGLRRLTAPWRSGGELTDRLCEIAKKISEVVECPVGEARRISWWQKSLV